MSTSDYKSNPFKSSLGENILRLSLSATFAFLCILVTTHFMKTLITPGDIEKKIYQFLSVDFVRIEPNRPSEALHDEEIIPPQEFKLEPPTPQLKQQTLASTRLPQLSIETSALDLGAVPLSFSAPKFETNVSNRPTQTKPVFNEQLFPLLTPSPTYPRRAKRARIEGWVNISFTIEIDGSVSDIQVLSAEPEGVFENTTTRSVQNWKYKPQLLAGKPSPRRVVQTIHFTLEK